MSESTKDPSNAPIHERPSPPKPVEQKPEYQGNRFVKYVRGFLAGTLLLSAVAGAIEHGTTQETSAAGKDGIDLTGSHPVTQRFAKF